MFFLNLFPMEWALRDPEKQGAKLLLSDTWARSWLSPHRWSSDLEEEVSLEHQESLVFVNVSFNLRESILSLGVDLSPKYKRAEGQQDLNFSDVEEPHPVGTVPPAAAPAHAPYWKLHTQKRAVGIHCTCFCSVWLPHLNKILYPQLNKSGM